MAERRMFAKTIIDSDAFLEMPMSTQALYFHLSMRADDDGFINNPKRLTKMLGSSDDELKVLFAKKFIIGFESGVIVIKHWKIHNYIQKDRYKKTNYADEMELLSTNEINGYSLDTECIQDGDTGKDRLELGKDRLGEVREIKTRTLVVSPKDHIPYQEIINHLNETMQSHYKTIDKTKALIKARFNEGFTLEDFKHVHIVKLAEWGMDEKMSKFLRPETLYGNKFEGYRNQKISDYEKSRLIQQQTGMSAKELLDIQLEAAEREWELNHAS